MASPPFSMQASGGDADDSLDLSSRLHPADGRLHLELTSRPSLQLLELQALLYTCALYTLHPAHACTSATAARRPQLHSMPYYHRRFSSGQRAGLRGRRGPRAGAASAGLRRTTPLPRPCGQRHRRGRRLQPCWLARRGRRAAPDDRAARQPAGRPSSLRPCGNALACVDVHAAVLCSAVRTARTSLLRTSRH